MHFQKVKPFNFAILVTILISLSLIAQPFADLKNGTIKDTNTGLIWEKCSAGQNWEKNCEGDSTMMNWESAMNYCKDLKLAEMEWKLPSYKEMRTILSLENSYDPNGTISTTQYRPAISLTFFPKTEHGYYWLGDEYTTTKTNPPHKRFAYYIRFDIPPSRSKDEVDFSWFITPKTSEMFVRCVSTGEKKKN